MRGGRGGVLAGLIAAALGGLLLCCSGAAASDVSGRVTLGDGYSLYLSANGDEGRDRPTITISRQSAGGDGAVSSYYRTNRPGARNGPRKINARLGSRGSVHLAFKPRDRRVQTSARPGCLDANVTRGTLVGRLRFRGENGYVDVQVHRLKAWRFGYVEHKGELCVHAPRANSQQVRGKRPPTFASCADDKPEFDAFYDRRLGKYIFEAEDFFVGSRSWRGLRVSHFAYALADRSNFTYDDALTEATLTPPEPFIGSARFEKPTLTGDLAMPVLGREPLPLTPVPGVLTRSNSISCSYAATGRRAARQLTGPQGGPTGWPGH